MKILLVVPTFHYKGPYPSYLSISDFPTGLAYIASALKEAGHEVTGLNLNNDTQYKSSYMLMANRIYKALQKDKYGLIGLGGLCIDYAFIKDAMGVIRKYTDTPIVLGGGIINNDAEFIFNLLKPNFCIIGEAEEAIVELANVLDNEITPIDYDIDNLGYLKDGKAVFTRTNYKYPDIDNKPFPDYDVFGGEEMVNNYSMATRVLYRYPRLYPRPMTIVTARHCPFNCSFCIHRGGPKYRARSIENILAEVKELYDKYKFNILIIADELFATNKKRLAEFCAGVLSGREQYGWDFDWMFQTHANARLDKETLELAKEAGCYFFSYGIESASPKVLESMNKKLKISQIIETIKLAGEVGIGFGGNLLFGDPIEDEETISDTLDFYAQHCQSSQIFLSMLVPYPGCKIFDYCIETGIITDKKQYYETIDEIIYNMTSMPNGVFAQWVNFLSVLEKSWMMTEATEGRVEKDPTPEPMGSLVYKVSAQCPYCKKGVEYRGIWLNTPRFLGVGCTKCNKKIRVNVNG